MITCRLSEDPRPPETIGTLVVNTMITDADRLPKKERDILRPNIGVVMLLLQTLYTVVMVGHRPHLLPFLMIGMTDGVGSVMEIIRPLPLHLGLGLHLAGEMTLKDCLQGKLLAVWSLVEAKTGRCIGTMLITEAGHHLHIATLILIDLRNLQLDSGNSCPLIWNCGFNVDQL